MQGITNSLLMQGEKKDTEIISPAGDWISLNTALQSGADAIYFGAEGYNMRAASQNFNKHDLKKIATICKKFNAKSYLAINATIYDHELKKIESIINTAKSSGIDSIVCWDMAIIELCQKIDIPFHISTQASVSNFSSLRHYASLGAKMVVLARELSLNQIKYIYEKVNQDNLQIKLECFVHGAMCVAVSGRCFISQDIFGRSANRGECVQPCRRHYRITDIEEEFELEIGSDYVMSPKDLCTIKILDNLYSTGIRGFKIEGRNRSPEYVATTTAAYRKAIDFIVEHREAENFAEAYRSLADELQDELARVYNRGFSEGFFFGKPANAWAQRSGSAATETKNYVGVVRKYFPKAGVAEILVHSPGIDSGGTLSIQGPATGLVTVPDAELHLDGQPVNRIEQGQIFTVRCDRVRKNDKVYVLLKN